MNNLEPLLEIDFNRYSPNINPTISLGQQVGENCLFVIFEQWGPEDEQRLITLLNCFESAFAADSSVSLLIYQGWFDSPQKEQLARAVTATLSHYSSLHPQMQRYKVGTLPPIEEAHLPSLIKDMKACLLWNDNPALFGRILAMDRPVIVSTDRELFWQAPFIYPFYSQKPDSLMNALKQAFSPQTFVTTPRQFILAQCKQHFNTLWEQIVSLQVIDRTKACDMLLKILYFMEHSVGFDLFQFAIATDILSKNNQWLRLDQFIDTHLFCAIGLDSPGRMSTIYDDAIRNCLSYLKGNDLTGDILEFGTFMGFTAQLFASRISEYGLSSHFHTFDSFTGFNEISPDDNASYESGVRKVWQKGSLRLSERVANRLTLKLNQILPGRVSVIRGYFEDTLKHSCPKHPVSLVNIDCDLYSPTLYVLDFLLEQQLLQDGCILMFDDFNCNRSNPDMGERRALKEAFAKQTRFTYSPWFSYGWSGQTFFVHDSDAIHTIKAF